MQTWEMIWTSPEVLVQSAIIATAIYVQVVVAFQVFMFFRRR